MKYFFLIVLLLTTAISHATSIEEQLWGDRQGVELTSAEREALKRSDSWKEGWEAARTPGMGADGSLLYPYGSQQIRIVCAVFRICEIRLQDGELITPDGVQMGDTHRWEILPTTSGEGSQQRIHIIVKPLDIDLETVLFIATNKRTYNFLLRSHRTEYMPRVSFTYPDEMMAKWAQIQTQKTAEREEKIIPKTAEYLGDLDFEYRVTGKAKWKPIRVYNDGSKTVIHMPPAMAQSEAPTLLVLRDKEQIIVNYRVQGDRYIVDTLFDEAVLVAGVGRKQTSVKIVRGRQ